MNLPDDPGIFSVGVVRKTRAERDLDRMRELLPAYERCDGFGCILTPTGILHDRDCSQIETVSS